MRKLVVTENTLDGVVDASEGWFAPAGDDEYRLFVYPVVLGRGARLFDGAANVPKLKLVDSRTFRSGIVLVRYSAAG
jgi:hypothetical protein